MKIIMGWGGGGHEDHNGMGRRGDMKIIMGWGGGGHEDHNGMGRRGT